MQNLSINPELKALIPPLTSEEFAQLEANVCQEGIREPIITWQGTIVDGHNRYELAQMYDLPFKVKEMAFASMEDCKEWMIRNQFGRRNLSNYQRSVLALELESVFKAKAKENQIRKPESVLQKSVEQKPIDTQKELAKVANVSHDTIAKVKVIEAKAPEEVKAKLSTGEVSINQVYQDIRKEEKKAEMLEKIQQQKVQIEISENIKNGDSLQILESLEDGCIDIVLTDPPYGISYVSNRSMYDETITKRGLLNDGKDEAFELLDKTCEILSRKAAENSHLYFFCSWAVFSSFEAIISKYFTIKTPIVWDKGNKGSGDLENDWGNQTEIVIFCVKGKKLVNTRRGNLLFVPRIHTTKMVHPTQKPTELLKMLLEVSYRNGDFVVDPFMGSGSTIKACKEINAKCLGIELDAEMFNIANNFINE
jgi:DNA modification methylase/transcriptional antiterminator Rof (Rho-off)